MSLESFCLSQASSKGKETSLEEILGLIQSFRIILFRDGSPHMVLGAVAA